MSKEERRQLFEAQVKAQDELAEMHKAYIDQQTEEFQKAYMEQQNEEQLLSRYYTDQGVDPFCSQMVLPDSSVATHVVLAPDGSLQPAAASAISQATSLFQQQTSQYLDPATQQMVYPNNQYQVLFQEDNINKGQNIDIFLESHSFICCTEVILTNMKQLVR